jgi:RimJ/RimL family protein N-acetyltransferase
MDEGAPKIAWPSCIPELATERLRLRAPLPRDAAALLALIGDPEVTKYIDLPTITTLAEAQALLERLAQRFAARDMIRWAIELVEHGEILAASPSLVAGRWARGCAFPTSSCCPTRDGALR